jgi:hypothetical protein
MAIWISITMNYKKNTYMILKSFHSFKRQTMLNVIHINWFRNTNERVIKQNMLRCPESVCGYNGTHKGLFNFINV